MSDQSTPALPPETRYTTMAAKVLATDDGATRTVVTVPGPDAAAAVAAALNGVVSALDPQSLAAIVDAGHACVDAAGVSHLRQHLLGVFDGTVAADQPGTVASAAAARLARSVADTAPSPAALRSVRDELNWLLAGLEDVLVVALVYVIDEDEQRLVINAALEQLSDDDVATLLVMPDAEDGDTPADWFDRQRGPMASVLYRLSLAIDCVTDAGRMRYDEDDRLWIDFQIVGQWDDDLASGLGALRRWAARHRPHLGATAVSRRYDTEVTVTAHVVTDPGSDPAAVAQAVLPELVTAGPVVLDDLVLKSVEVAPGDGDPTAAVTVLAAGIVEAADRYQALQFVRTFVTGPVFNATTGDAPLVWEQVTVTGVTRPIARR